jgi:hypothetical protein
VREIWRRATNDLFPTALAAAMQAKAGGSLRASSLRSSERHWTGSLILAASGDDGLINGSRTLLQIRSPR